MNNVVLSGACCCSRPLYGYTHSFNAHCPGTMRTPISPRSTSVNEVAIHHIDPSSSHNTALTLNFGLKQAATMRPPIPSWENEDSMEDKDSISSSND